MNKKVYLKINIAGIALIIFFLISSLTVRAHDSDLGIDGNNGITFDSCEHEGYVSSTNIGDGYNEKWYDLEWGYIDRTTSPNTFVHTVMCHIDDDITTIYCQFKDTGLSQPTTTWSTGVGEYYGEIVKTAYESSLLKWNNVYYYKINENGLYEKHKVINLVNFDDLNDTTGIEPNLLIYPYYDNGNFTAVTDWVDSSEIVSKSHVTNGISHKHYRQYTMEANTYFLRGSINLRNRTGAHEMGHVLGLYDIDTVENPNVPANYHHEEILMGYAKNSDGDSRQSEITYKDIAGVGITRGFHTNSDHIWLRVDDTNKVICSLCNAIVNDANFLTVNGKVSYMGCPVYQYKQCGHSETNLPTTVDNNMIPVASYGNTDYYKCKYCRYVGPFTSRITQNYICTGEYTENYHILENQSNNLLYKTFEEHNIIILGEDNYRCSDCNYHIINTYYECTLSNYSSPINQTITLDANKKSFYKINSNYQKNYEFILNINPNIDVKLYNDNFDEISINDLDSRNSVEHFIQNLQTGTYYLAIVNNASVSATISLKIQSRNTAYLGIGENDVLINSYNGFKDYNYINYNRPGFFKFALVGEKEDGSLIVYPSSAIKIYNDSNKTQLLQKFDLEGYDNSASLKQNENNMYVYLPRKGYFYLDVNFNAAGLKSLKLVITEATSDNLNLFDLSENTNETINVINENKKGDYFKSLYLKQTGKFTVTFNYSGIQNNSILVVLAKQNYDETTGEYSLDTKVIAFLNKDNTTYTYSASLEDGMYYIGYFNKADTITVTVSFERLVTQSGSEVLVTDPDQWTLAGSQINIVESNMNIYDRSYRQSFITVGFTRLIYPNYNYGISPSRLDYDWYSSNTSIATVTNYGTVLGKSAGTVKIMAVLKSDPSKVYVKEFTIINDTGTGIVEIESTYTIKYSRDVVNGKFHFDIEKINCPYPWLQDYTWKSTYCHSDSISASMDNWGYITVNGTGCFTLTGTYNVNSRYRVKIHFVIEP